MSKRKNKETENEERKIIESKEEAVKREDRKTDIENISCKEQEKKKGKRSKGLLLNFYASFYCLTLETFFILNGL